MRRGLLALIAVVLLPAALAEARDVRLRSPARLRAAVVTTAGGPAVRLRWRDTARGETRWEVLRGRRRVVLRANSARYTDRRVERGRRYRYRVRPCRRHRCARWTSAVVTLPASATTPALPPGPASGGSATPPSGGSGPSGGAATPDPFAGSPTIGGCPVFPKDTPGTPTSRASP